MNKNEILEKLSDLKNEVEIKNKVIIKGVFGSYARGEATNKSDIDILVEFKKGASLLDFVDISIFLEEKLGVKVDVVSERTIKNEIKPYVYRDLIAV
ncbi:MAG TPA: nucleotidyltransferase family protein [Spirochaetota bacterium]|jgi:hypothetical protein|nr:MAG: Nucleotidyltransferase domain protein [Spirochaetes bacterium ADurb.Bin133]HNZ27297.1 nucleotidyltransferase family protein [Spirochaetota bacterium]HPY87445.1 nucleotidyltransferase family protein [Spirochaetota bacterium]HQB61240.1 nucleotidyltransferase family protein [Spirochaetota bacterium]